MSQLTKAVVGLALLSCVVQAVACGDNKLSEEYCQANPQVAGCSEVLASANAAANLCADVTIKAEGEIPNVYLIVDQSGSMQDPFDGQKNRWDAMRDLLIGEASGRPSGLIAELQSSVRFGFAMYSSLQGANAPSGAVCPMINNPGNAVKNPSLQAPIVAAIDNYDAIEDLFDDANYLGDTPTGDTIRWMREWIAANHADAPGNDVFLLATDGAPDSCKAGYQNPQGAQAAQVQGWVVDEVKAAFAANIRTFVIGVADEIPAAHLQAVANAGVGSDGKTKAPFFVANTVAQLQTALTSSVLGSRSCRLSLNGEIQDPSLACQGEVTLSIGDDAARVLECGGENGWKAIDGKTIELVGDACRDLQQSDTATVQGSFPCNVGRLI